MTSKVRHAIEFIERTLKAYHRPIVMSSFGKDSMVLLHLFKLIDAKPAILFHREPFSPKKHAFANRIIEQEDYTCYDYAPSLTQIVKVGDVMEVVNGYQVGREKVTWFGTKVVAPESGKPFLCGYKDLYMRPTGTFNYPWDVVFVGHKSSDVDPILGPVPLKVDIAATDGGPDFAYPLRHFTDDDVWDFINTYGVAYNERRYDAGSRKEMADLTYNDDYHHACMACMDRDGPAGVHCPLLNCEVSNISASIRYVEPAVPSYIGKE